MKKKMMMTVTANPNTNTNTTITIITIIIIIIKRSIFIEERKFRKLNEHSREQHDYLNEENAV